MALGRSDLDPHHVSRKREHSLTYKVNPEAGTGGTESYIGTWYYHAIIFPLTFHTKVARREKEVSGRISVAMLDRCLYHRPKTWQMALVVMINIQSSQRTPTVTEKLAKPSVEEKQRKPPHSEDAISGNAYQGKAISDRIVLEATEETG